MTRKLHYDADLQSVDAAHKLSELSLGLLKGRVGLRSDNKEVVCHPGGVIRLRMEAEESDTKGKLRIELDWPVRLTVHPE